MASCSAHQKNHFQNKLSKTDHLLSDFAKLGATRNSLFLAEKWSFGFVCFVAIIYPILTSLMLSGKNLFNVRLGNCSTPISTQSTKIYKDAIGGSWPNGRAPDFQPKGWGQGGPVITIIFGNLPLFSDLTQHTSQRKIILL